MFESIKEYIFKTLIVKGVISKLEKLLAKLPLDDAKTVTGLLIVCLGLVLQSLPQTAPFIEPVLLALKSLPSEEIVAGGLLWSIVGMFHQLLKFIVKIGGFETEKEKVENKKIEKIVEKLKEEK